MSKVFPLVNQTGWKPNPHTYRKVVATSEITSGAILTLMPNSGNQVYHNLSLEHLMTCSPTSHK